MSSSTSSSEPGAPSPARAWSGFVRLFVAVAAGQVLALLALAFLLDPYDSGRSPLKLKDGVRPQGPRTAIPSRGRDPRFEGAILGNSHVQLLSPAELGNLTGVPFVSLTAPATRPKEILTIADWFLRHRRQPARALVFGIDEYWCTADASLTPEKPFPFWLYSRDLTQYLAGLLRFDVLEELQRRVAYLMAKAPAREAADGYWDYEPNYIPQGFGRDPARLAELEQPRRLGGGNIQGPFPAAQALGELMSRFPPQTVLVLLRPPTYVSALPVPGSADAQADRACRDAFAALAAQRPRTVLLDWRADRPELHDANRFFDHTHYRHALARRVEADIAAAIARHP